MSQRQPICIIDRQTGDEFEEVVLGEKWIRWAYQDASSSLIEKMLFRSPLISKLMGAYYDSALSRSKIDPTIKELGIDESEFANPKNSYNNFNEFFI
ncbi:MAG TPA: phosphatidylserine decarboxylase, partial [Rhizobiales bacterium]|nr:phosphatidylserine decarboxylase [Hyphomicrobiales bacterium]